MRLILWLLALAAAAVVVVIAAKYEDNGHILLVIHPYQIELTLNIFIMILIGAFLLFYVAVRLLLKIFGFNKRYRLKKADLMTQQSLKSFFEGNFDNAKKSAAFALKNANSSSIKTINTVIAARSAHNLEEFSQRDNFLNKVDIELAGEKALQVTQAELLIDQGHYKEALDTLHSIYSTGGLQQTAVLQLELEAQQQTKDWDAVLELTELLKRRQPVNKSSINEIRRYAHIENIKKYATDLLTLNNYWHHLSPEEKTDSKLACAASQAYIALKNCATAHEIIENSIVKDWDTTLITLYAECLDYHVSRQIEKAEVWLKTQPNNSHLLLTLGKLCTHCELWGKAQNYLEASLSVEPSHAAHLALAQLHEKLEKHELAREQYKKGLSLTTK